MTNKKVCVITGANSGIGKATALEMAKKDYIILMVARDSEKSRQAFNEIKSESKNEDVYLYYADLSSQQSIRDLVSRIKAKVDMIDVLINNAGVLKRKEEYTVDGIEVTLAVNYLAPFLLTMLLLDKIKKSQNGRIVNVTSELYKNGVIDFNNNNSKFNGNDAYAISKKLMVYFTQYLAKQEPSITVNCLHPGVIATDSFREYPKIISKMLNFFLPKPHRAAAIISYLSTDPSLQSVSGKYFYKNEEKDVIEEANHAQLLDKIWKYSCETTKLHDRSL
ncbi:MAG: SDR family NAD(P)-dependent oxidoreductase [Candidatus Heimdallarchaeota archaeon]|nr:SDR family NAD(P)-dependent oxidoreductase [Candidatus Heimdallarchaeota archaeon]